MERYFLALPMVRRDTAQQTRRADRLDLVFDVLANEHCRRIVRYFADAETNVVSVDTLLDDCLEGSSSPDDRDRLELRFHHVVLPKLVDACVVDYDARSGTVRYRGTQLWERIANTVPE